MTLLLPTLAVAFAAFCVWLTVRVVNRKERWAKWTLAAVLVVVFVVYPVSMGPTLRLRNEGVWPFYDCWDAFYAPMIGVYHRGGPPHRVMKWYLELWLPYEMDS